MAKVRASGRHKNGSCEKVFIAVITFLNLLLSVILAVINRQEVIHAVQENDDVKLLLTSKSATKSVPPTEK